MPEENQKNESNILLQWSSPSRPFKKRDRDFFTTIGAMAFLIVVILFFMKEWLLIGAILALIFVVYVLNTIPPEEIKHEITTQGLISGQHNYKWEDLKEFWFYQKYGHETLLVQTKMRFPPRLIILLNGTDKEIIKKTLSPHLMYKEIPEKTWMDNAADWLSKKVPLEKPA